MPKFLFGIIFFSISNLAVAQLQDNFSDGDFTTNPVWSGDAGDFAVSVSGQLQLNAATSGESYLTVPLPQVGGGAMEWRFFIRENFSPSSSNYCRIYLVSDSSNPEGNVNGYYLRFGESLANDAVELFRQDGNTSVSVCRASDGQIASSFAMGVKVTRDEIGLWTLWLDPSGGTDYVPAATGAEGMYSPTGYFGIACVYTSGNRQNFYFDDFLIGPLIGDTLAPEIVSVSVPDSISLDIRFNEIVDPVSSSDVSHYSIGGQNIHPGSAQRDPGDLALVHLEFAQSFSPAIPITLLTSGVLDLAGNSVAANQVDTFIYYPPVQVSVHDVIFTEVMFEPSSTSILPNEEYIEIYNTRNEAIHLKDWTLSDGSSTAVFPEFILMPKTYTVLCAEENVPLFSVYGTTIGLNSFPGLNNDLGDNLELKNEQGILLDNFLFNNDSYHSTSKDDGGWSLERIDTNFLCEDDFNWKASIDPSGGSPGRRNSVAGTYHDETPIALLRAYLEDSLHVIAVCNKIPDESSLFEMNNYSFYSENHFLGYPLNVETLLDSRKIRLELPFTAGNGMYSLRVSGNFRDCPGNLSDSNHVVRFAFPEPVVKGDVVINEILFHPMEYGSDFVEIYNCSQKILNMKDWRIAEGDYEAPENILSNEQITDEPFLLFPGDYLAMSEDPDGIFRVYPGENKYTIINVPDLPDFNSTEGEVVLQGPDGNRLDEFIYTEELHYPLLTNTAGVSLERLSPFLPDDAEENWHSASSLNGYASPGYRNSNFILENGMNQTTKLEPGVFSPDNDGVDDLLFIHLEDRGEQLSGEVLIYNTEGKLIRTLARHYIFGSQSILVWDGTSDMNERVDAGMYIVYGNFFNAEGSGDRFKKVCAVAYR